jgi:hypothetical protein
MKTKELTYNDTMDASKIATRNVTEQLLSYGEKIQDIIPPVDLKAIVQPIIANAMYARVKGALEQERLLTIIRISQLCDNVAVTEEDIINIIKALHYNITV